MNTGWGMIKVALWESSWRTVGPTGSVSQKESK